MVWGGGWRWRASRRLPNLRWGKSRSSFPLATAGVTIEIPRTSSNLHQVLASFGQRRSRKNMSLTHYIFREMDSMLEEMNAMHRPSRKIVRAATMPCDVTEDKECLTIQAELPGVPKEKISINIDKNVLTIEGEKEDAWASVDEEPKHYLRERIFGKVTRSFQLPSNLLMDSSKCIFENGTLTISFKKDPSFSTCRKIEIQ